MRPIVFGVWLDSIPTCISQKHCQKITPSSLQTLSDPRCNTVFLSFSFTEGLSVSQCVSFSEADMGLTPLTYRGSEVREVRFGAPSEFLRLWVSPSSTRGNTCTRHSVPWERHTKGTWLSPCPEPGREGFHGVGRGATRSMCCPRAQDVRSGGEKWNSKKAHLSRVSTHGFFSCFPFLTNPWPPPVPPLRWGAM